MSPDEANRTPDAPPGKPDEHSVFLMKPYKAEGAVRNLHFPAKSAKKLDGTTFCDGNACRRPIAGRYAVVSAFG